VMLVAAGAGRRLGLLRAHEFIVRHSVVTRSAILLLPKIAHTMMMTE
jgi:hypothetical protein